MPQMKKHFKIVLFSVILGTIIPPLLVATFIGILSGEPFILIYPAVIPVSMSLGGPFSLIGSVLLTAVGLKKIKSGQSSFKFKSWATIFSTIGLSFGLGTAILVSLIVERGRTANILEELLYIVPNFLVTSFIISLLFSIVWHRYSKKLIAEPFI